MERSWLQQQASLSKFDGYRDSEPFGKAKITAAPAPKACSRAVPEAGLNGDVVFAPEEPMADWSGFAPRNCPGRRMLDGGLPAAHRETITRSEEHGIVPAQGTLTEDSMKTRRKIVAEPARAGAGLVLGGPAAPGPEERFTTAARAANAQESTPLEMKGDGGYRCRNNIGKKHITPPYEQSAAVIPRVGCPGEGAGGGRGEQDPGRVGQAPPTDLFALRSAPLNYGSRGRAAATNGPGSFLKDMGRQMAGSGAAGGGSALLPPGGGRERTAVGGGHGGAGIGAGEDPGPRRKELYASNFNPYMSGYTGHQRRR